MLDALFDVYQGMESAKKLWEALENMYMTEDASSKSSIVSQFNNYKMVEGCSILNYMKFNESYVISSNIKCTWMKPYSFLYSGQTSSLL